MDMPGMRVTPARPRTAISKLKLGTSSKDRVTAEILQKLPDDALIAFAADMDRPCQELDFDKGWTDSAAVLIPKSHGARSLDMFRPLACLVTMRKLLGYLWLSSLQSLCLQTFQTAFVKGTHAMHWVFELLKAAELWKE